MSNAWNRKSPKKSDDAVVVQRNSGERGFKESGGGVVQYCLHGATSKILKSNFTPSKLIEVLRGGLPMQELNDLQASLDVPINKLLPVLGISKATFHRRKAKDRLDPAESERVVRFAKLMGKAIEVLESEEDARQWLTSPQFGLGGVVPLEYARTEVGAREVEDLLCRIEYGVYS